MSNDSGKTSHIEIVQNPDVIEFLKNCSFMREPTGDEIDEIINSFVSVGDFSGETLPENLITVNSSSYEAHVREDIPYTNVGYIKLVTTLLKNNELLALAKDKFIDPFRVAKLMDEKDGIFKKDLFKYVSNVGAFPRKTFSMGEGVEKRYYLEGRRITK